MYAVFGLGNPDKEYDKTRHNIGFDVIDELASQMGVEVKTKRHKALCGIGNIGGEKVILVKPQTYMNLSGESVRAVMDFYKLDPENDIIVISDDINLATGRIRIRAQGSAGGHNGLKSIINHAGTQKFKRVRVGVGANEGFFVALFAPVMGHSMAVSAMLLSRGSSFYVLVIVSAAVSMFAQFQNVRRSKCQNTK